MNRRTFKSLLALSLILASTQPMYARGFGGFRGSGGGFGGRQADFSDRGFDRGFGDNANRSFDSSFDHSNFGNSSFGADHPQVGGGGFGADHPNVGSGTFDTDHSNVGSGTFGANHPDAGSGAFGADHSNIGGDTLGSEHPDAGSGNWSANHPNAGTSGTWNADHNVIGADGGWGGAGNNINRFSNDKVNNFAGNKLELQGSEVRNSFSKTTVNDISHDQNLNGYHTYNGYGYHGAYNYNHGYYGFAHFYGYPGGWYNPGFMEATMWTFMGVTSLETFLGMAALSSSHNNKQQPAVTTNVTYQGDNIYINGVPSATYYSQAKNLATSTVSSPGANGSTTTIVGASTPANGITQDFVLPGSSTAITTPAKSEKWEPLGVYSLVEPGQTQSTTIFQLAINKEGVVRGNYLNQITNEKAQVQGAVDKKTGQISWYVGNNPTTIFETSLSQLANKDSTVVVQFGEAQTHQMGLIRLPKPKNS